LEFLHVTRTVTTEELRLQTLCNLFLHIIQEGSSNPLFFI